MAFVLEMALAASLSAATVNLTAGSLAATRSGNDLALSFPTTSPGFYAVQTCPGLRQEWTNSQAGVPGDGTVKMVRITNAILGGSGFYRLSIQTPTRLLLPQSAAFAILGYSCGGIQEKVYVTGFELTNGYPSGDVYLSTSCSTGRAGSPPSVHTAWAAVTWDFAGNVISSAKLANGVTVSTNFIATDPYRDIIYNTGAAAYLVVPVPAAPAGVTAVQSGDQFQVSWTPNAINPAAVVLSTLTATPVNSPAPTLTTTVAGSTTSGVISSLEPQTTYQITIVNTTIGGAGATSTPTSVTTFPATISPSAPVGVAATWTNPDPTGATDTLVAAWQAAIPGDSPIDQYRIIIVGSDGAGTFKQTASGTTLTASFTVDWVPNWSVTVQAHNATGWGPSSSVITLGGL